jgi:hypothetical protein
MSWGAVCVLVVDGRDQLDLAPGTEITMTGVAPRAHVSQR